MAEFLLDENVLGLGRYLIGIKYKKIGDEGCPAKKTDDKQVVEYAMKNNLVIVTGDGKMIKQCGFLNVNCIGIDLEEELVKKIKEYNNSYFKTFEIRTDV